MTLAEFDSDAEETYRTELASILTDFGTTSADVVIFDRLEFKARRRLLDARLEVDTWIYGLTAQSDVALAEALLQDTTVRTQLVATLQGNANGKFTSLTDLAFQPVMPNSTPPPCMGSCQCQTFYASSGVLDDGSGAADYQSNSYCEWIIAPIGASEVTLFFDSFVIEETYDRLE
eukprot:312431-Rhodomonas_salina.1